MFDNPKSKIFKGATKSFKDYDENGEKKRKPAGEGNAISSKKEKQSRGQTKAVQAKKVTRLGSMMQPKTRFLVQKC